MKPDRLIRRSALALSASAVVAACRSAAPAAPNAPLPEVGIVVIEPQRLSTSYEFVGEVQPWRRVQVRSRVEGVIEARPFTEGSTVQPGEVLYRLERIRYDAAYRSAKARADNAKRLLDRLEPLLAEHAVAQQDVDNARAQLETATAELDFAKKNLDDTEVKAEIAGRVGRTMMEVGARVTGPADLLTTIDQLDRVYVTFHPPVSQLLAWKSNPRWAKLLRAGGDLTVRAVLPDGTALPRTGKLNFLSPSLDPVTGTQEFRATFENKDRLLLPGQFVRVRLDGFEADDAIAVPRRAVLQGLGGQYVLVVGSGDTVAMRDVQPGKWSGEQWIIEKGLSPGDRVVIDGTQRAIPRRPVKPVIATDTAAATRKATQR